MKRLVILSIAFMLMLTAVSCGSEKSSTNTPSNEVDDYLKKNKKEMKEEVNGLEKGQSEYLEEIFGLFEESMVDFDENEKKLMRDVIKKVADFDYKIEKEKINGDKATVVVVFTTYNFGEKFENNLQELITEASQYTLEDMSEAELTKRLFINIFEALNDADKTFSAELEFKLKREDGKWKVEENIEDMTNILWGNMLQGIGSMTGL